MGNLDQAKRKIRRRRARAAKAARLAPRPLQKLRPIVHCPTQRYNAKIRLGRGFSLDELEAVKISPKYARTIGIAVDHRRRNLSVDGIQVNVDRLKEYLAKLVMFDKKSTPEELEMLSQYKTGTIMPIVKPKKEIEMQEVTEEMKNLTAYTTMRHARKETKVAGYRQAVANRKK